MILFEVTWVLYPKRYSSLLIKGRLQKHSLVDAIRAMTRRPLLCDAYRLVVVAAAVPPEGNGSDDNHDRYSDGE